ncbi:MAG: hypothetical protein IKC79_00995 [Clostridia bacterium]|nr:hypothetical protein [Clostridia bacterium]
MNKIQKGKAGLLSLGIMLIILGVVCGVFAVICTTSTTWWLWIIAALLYILALGGLLLGITFTWTACSLHATRGSIAEDNLGIGTVNMTKCPKCGSAVGNDDQCYSNCGNTLSDTTTCPKCNATTKKDNKHCSSCGQELS